MNSPANASTNPTTDDTTRSFNPQPITSRSGSRLLYQYSPPMAAMARNPTAATSVPHASRPSVSSTASTSTASATPRPSTATPRLPTSIPDTLRPGADSASSGLGGTITLHHGPNAPMVVSTAHASIPISTTRLVTDIRTPPLRRLCLPLVPLATGVALLSHRKRGNDNTPARCLDDHRLPDDLAQLRVAVVAAPVVAVVRVPFVRGGEY